MLLTKVLKHTHFSSIITYIIHIVNTDLIRVPCLVDNLNSFIYLQPSMMHSVSYGCGIKLMIAKAKV